MQAEPPQTQPAPKHTDSFMVGSRSPNVQARRLRLGIRRSQKERVNTGGNAASAYRTGTFLSQHTGHSGHLSGIEARNSSPWYLRRALQCRRGHPCRSSELVSVREHRWHAHTQSRNLVTHELVQCPRCKPLHRSSHVSDAIRFHREVKA